MFYIIVAIIGSVAMFLAAMPGVYLMSQPTKKAYVRIISIQEFDSRYYVSFEFRSGIEKKIAVECRIFETMQINDTGTLTYKEMKLGKRYHHKVFINFEKSEGIPVREANS
jgi:hypothetical protein